MGIAVGDYDNDGRDDIYVTNFSDDSNTLYHNDGGAAFTDVTVQSTIHEPTFPFLGWGVGMIDVDNDGLLDLFVANGHVYPEVDEQDWGMTWKERPLLFMNKDGRRFDLAVAATGSGLAVLRSARGAAFGDIDNDGDIDVVMNAIDDAPAVLLNRTSGRHWLTVKLVGGSGGPRDAIGATVTCVVGGKRLRGLVASGASFVSQSELRVHFGLGAQTKVDSLEVRWPLGLVERVKVPGVDRIVTVVEGKNEKASPQPKP
jgi:hypothetical protein